jgi:hypothetical protein
MMITNGKMHQTIFYTMADVFFHPPMSYSEFLKRKDEALFIRVVGGEQTPTTACYFILSNTCNGGNASTSSA